jgi:hypothetical protein
MILTAAAVTIGLAATVGGLTVGLVAVFVRVLAIIDVALTGDDGSEPGGGSGTGAGEPEPPPETDGDPAWWPEFEAQLAAYVHACRRRAA